MDELELLIDLHIGGERQGPGSDANTLRAIESAGLKTPRPDGHPLRIADIGCGTGASTLVIARELHAEITAVDFIPEFLQKLEQNAAAAGLEERIRTVCASMDELPFEEGSFDVIWSEGAVYNMGFENGVREWRRFLAPGGLLVVTELSWLGADRPAAIQAHWENEYPEIDTVSGKLGVLERHGYVPKAYFALPEDCWTEQYYAPMQARFEAFLERNARSEQAVAIVEAEKGEIALYQAYGDYYGYGMYVAAKR